MAVNHVMVQPSLLQPPSAAVAESGAAASVRAAAARQPAARQPISVGVGRSNAVPQHLPAVQPRRANTGGHTTLQPLAETAPDMQVRGIRIRAFAIALSWTQCQRAERCCVCNEAMQCLMVPHASGWVSPLNLAAPIVMGQLPSTQITDLAHAC